MDLSPNDIRNFEFEPQMRGYNKDNVRDFLEQIATAMDNAKQKELKLSMEIDSLKTQLIDLRQYENTIKSAAIDARRNADLTVENAKKEAKLITDQAKIETNEIINSRASKITNFEEEITKLQLTKKSYMTKLRNLIKSHLETIEELSIDDSEINSSDADIEATKSIDLTHGESETANDESSQSVTDVEQSDDTTIQDESGDKPVDPELAAALEGYKGNHDQTIDNDMTPAASPDGETVEIAALGDNVPDGFVADNSVKSDRNSTDKIKTQTHDENEITEHNSIDVDKDNTEKKTSMDAKDLANELDNVAAKFEEEMDKADKL
ncbi:MAG: DivIVA domain-containing protein [candidate division Zixibacteria bacterium]|nr:DivIVA domain-containing protein [candidate division Zixibacteria bacterium]